MKAASSFLSFPSHFDSSTDAPATRRILYRTSKPGAVNDTFWAASSGLEAQAPHLLSLVSHFPEVHVFARFEALILGLVAGLVLTLISNSASG